MENTETTQDYPADGDAASGDGELEALASQLSAAEGKVAEMRETLLRERAELDNQRKRLQRDVEQARRFANEKLLAELLPVLDNLERGLAVEGGDYAVLRSGVELTLRDLTRVVNAGGLKAVDGVGEVFDPERHQAMSMVDGSGHAAGRVVSVMQKGYVLNDRLLRPALVSVSK